MKIKTCKLANLNLVKKDDFFQCTELTMHYGIGLFKESNPMMHCKDMQYFFRKDIQCFKTRYTIELLLWSLKMLSRQASRFWTIPIVYTLPALCFGCFHIRNSKCRYILLFIFELCMNINKKENKCPHGPPEQDYYMFQ